MSGVREVRRCCLLYLRHVWELYPFVVEVGDVVVGELLCSCCGFPVSLCNLLTPPGFVAWARVGGQVRFEWGSVAYVFRGDRPQEVHWRHLVVISRIRQSVVVHLLTTVGGEEYEEEWAVG